MGTMFKTVALTLALVGVTQAYCPNGCSGHGTCSNSNGMKDTCSCFSHLDDGDMVAMWTGADCSLRTCPSAGAWAASASSHNDHVSNKVECSAKGKCDRSSGDCACEDADAGAAANLFAVPNSNKDCDNCIGTENTGAQYDSAWDASRAQGCKCDAGFRGPDCSLKECPSGDDTLEGHGGSKGRACSGRGSCDYASGQCVCYTGFYGHRCQSMTVLA